MPTTTALPRWDMTPFFPGLDSKEFETALAQVDLGTAELEALFDTAGVGAGTPLPMSPELKAQVEAAIHAYNALMEEVRLIGAYIAAFVTTDTRDELAQARDSEFKSRQPKLAKLGTRLTAWFGRLPIADLCAASPTIEAHRYALEKGAFLATKLMSPEEEALAADLRPTGISAWSKLHGDWTSQLEVAVQWPPDLGPQTSDLRPARLSMSQVRNLAYDPDRAVRKAAFEAELAAWKAAEIPCAASINSIKGEVNLIARKRGWDSPLDETLFVAQIDRETLDAMLGAAQESFPAFRRYLKAKAKALGLSQCSFYDIFAPLPSESFLGPQTSDLRPSAGRNWSFDEGMAFVVEQFRTYSDKLADFAQRNYDERWIDAEPRNGKHDGAYCMGLKGDVSRVFMNYKTAFGSVSTLAHELGHAYHNVCLANRTYLQRATPMTLAETASIFCETIIRTAGQERVPDAEKLTILEASLQGSCQVVVDITSRYLFESEVFEKRRARELSARELCEIMVDAQRQTYGDGLDEAALHPYMWAVKPHYYSGRSFYNFPYMFGLLFGLGLFARYQEAPEAFKEGYDDLLSSTGLADAATLAKRFDIDTRSKDFWRSSLKVIEVDIERFEALVDG
ncbi:MAG: M3 family oligoendopeptidase [Armatimonadetes bacterium]|nr:M3 family oligoendopeptidase [Armatimonadota bacterium]